MVRIACPSTLNDWNSLFGHEEFRTTSRTSSALTLGVLATGAAAQQASTANLIFAVDESGSMSTEHGFLPGFATDVDTALTGAGFSDVNFGLTGYSVGGQGRDFSIGGSLLGSAADFGAATNNLSLSGGTEDGYAAIDFVLNKYTIPSGESTTIILVTDEDRDDTDPSLTFGSISQDLNDAGVNLISVVNAALKMPMANTAIASDGVAPGSTAYVQDGTGFTTAPFGSVTSGDGSTVKDYVELAFETPNGCAATLNELRDGGDAAQAFSAVLLECLTIAATGGGGQQVVPLNQYRDTTKTVMDNHRAQVRRMAYGLGVDFETEGTQVSMSTRDQSTAFDMGGLRGYFAAPDTGANSRPTVPTSGWSTTAAGLSSASTRPAITPGATCATGCRSGSTRSMRPSTPRKGRWRPRAPRCRPMPPTVRPRGSMPSGTCRPHGMTSPTPGSRARRLMSARRTAALSVPKSRPATG